jgi:hypothetical protein
LTDQFNSVLGDRLSPLGYTRRGKDVFARNFSPTTIGTICYLTAKNRSSIKPFVGIHFAQVEKLYDELMSPFLLGPRTLSEYFPTCFRDLHELKQERSADPDFRLKERSYLEISTSSISHVCDQILVDLRQCGLPYIDFNASLNNAAATMAEERGGGIGTVAYRLPIIYWMLGRTNEATQYMTEIASKKYPIDPYENYADLLTARVNAGPAPLSRGFH